jgi:site-specific recombinase XerD
MVPLINNAGATLRWFVQDVRAQFGGDHTKPGVPLLPSERKNADGSAARVGDEALRAALASAAKAHLPDWPDVVTPHVLRHFCASELYLGGMDLIAIQATLGHAWVATTMNYARARHPRRGCLDRGPAARRRAAEGTEEMTIALAAGGGREGRP